MSLNKWKILEWDKKLQTNKQWNIFALWLSLKICLLRNWVKVAKIKQGQIFICFQYCNFTWRVQLTSILCWKPCMKWQFYLTRLTYFHLVLKALYEVAILPDAFNLLPSCAESLVWSAHGQGHGVSFRIHLTGNIQVRTPLSVHAGKLQHRVVQEILVVRPLSLSL